LDSISFFPARFLRFRERLSGNQQLCAAGFRGGWEMAAASRRLSGGIAYFADEAFMFSMKISKFAAENARDWAAPRKRINFLHSACANFRPKNH